MLVSAEIQNQKGKTVVTVAIEESCKWKSDVSFPVSNGSYYDQTKQDDLECESRYPALIAAVLAKIPINDM